MTNQTKLSLWGQTRPFSNLPLAARGEKAAEYGLCGVHKGSPSGSLSGGGLSPSQICTSIWGFTYSFKSESSLSPQHPTLKIFSICLCFLEGAASPSGRPRALSPLRVWGLWAELASRPQAAPAPAPSTALALISFLRRWAGWDPATDPTKLPSRLQTFVLSTELQKMQLVLLMSSLFG